MTSNVLQNEYYSSFINEIWRWQQDKLQGTIEKIKCYRGSDAILFYMKTVNAEFRYFPIFTFNLLIMNA